MLIFAPVAIFKVLVRHFFILFALLVPLFVSGQDPYHTSITKANGLPSNAVYFLFQDSKGFVWMAHDEGLSRYDGFEFKNYGSEVQGSKAGTDIKEDKFGRIWYTNFDGYLFYVQNDVMRSLEQNDPMGYMRYAIIDDRLLVMQKKGIDIFNLADLKRIKTIPFNTTTIGGAVGGKEYMYISFDPGVYLINKEGKVDTVWRNENAGIFSSGNGITFIDRINERRKFDYYDARSGYKAIHTGEVKYIQGYVFADSTHWLCTTNGLWGYTSDGAPVNSNRPFYPSKNITGILVDNEQNYWVSTSNEGVLFIPDINTRMLQGGFMPNNLLRKNDKIFATTKKNSIYAYDVASGGISIVYKDSIEHPVYALLKRTDDPGYILLSKELQFLSATFTKEASLGGAYKDIVQVDDKYCAYAGSGNSGLIKLRDGSKSEWDALYDASSALSVHNVVRLIPSGRGRLVKWLPALKTIYFGANDGLYKVTPKGVSVVTYKGAPIIAASIEAFSDKLYVVTMQNKFLEVLPDASVNEILLKDNALKIFKIKKVDNAPVLVTNKGIMKFVPSTGQLGNSYTTAIPGEEVNDIAPVGNSLIVATDKGLFISESTAPYKMIPKLYVRSLTVNGKAYPLHGELIFTYEENDIDIGYSIFSYKTGGSYPLYYAINGGKWQAAGSKSRSLKLASLAPGNYTVSFRFAGGTEEQSLSFEITKPVWMRWWFLALGALIVFTMGIIYYKWQTGLLKKKNALLVEKVKLEKSLHSSMLTSIKSQMNPHFFYNALNTIQSYIFSDDKRNATTYLSKFSKLTRTILEMSEKETVSLSEEIAALTLYLDLEKARFNDALNFSIYTGPGLDADNIKLPSMIIQPYVENSIKHGLLHQKAEKILTLNFEVKNNDLCVTIDDSGIGRKKSEELNKIRTDRHTSFATGANLKRIEILNKGKENIGVKYIDKVNDLGQATGTTLIITIPLVKATTHVH